MKRNDTVEHLAKYLLSENKQKVMEAMAHIWGLIALSFDFGINPLVGLRQVFPEFEWAYVRTDPSKEEYEQGLSPDQPTELAKNCHFMWDFIGGVVFARFKEGMTKKYSFAATTSLTDHEWCSPYFRRYTHLCIRDSDKDEKALRLSKEGAEVVSKVLLFR